MKIRKITSRFWKLHYGFYHHLYFIIETHPSFTGCNVGWFKWPFFRFFEIIVFALLLISVN